MDRPMVASVSMDQEVQPLIATLGQAQVVVVILGQVWEQAYIELRSLMPYHVQKWIASS
jgi:hypothetical protein